MYWKSEDLRILAADVIESNEDVAGLKEKLSEIEFLYRDKGKKNVADRANQHTKTFP